MNLIQYKINHLQLIFKYFYLNNFKNVDDGKYKKINEFVESQKRISNLNAVMNEKEVRLMEVEGKTNKTKSKKSANDGRTSPPDSMAATTIK